MYGGGATSIAGGRRVKAEEEGEAKMLGGGVVRY
jgi:hypothetical protein